MELTLKALRQEKQEIEKLIAECEQSILNKYQLEIEETLADKDEPYGDVTIGNIKFKIPKYIKWNTEKLEEIAAELDNPQEWIDYELSVSEAKFKTLPDILKDKFSKARSIKSGKINISFKE